MNVFDFTVKDMKGEDVPLKQYEGKVLLIVNTATGCGFTPQYAGLQTLYERYRELGFEILDFPCNSFGGQAPGTEDEIHEFCVGRFGVTFPQFHKIKVNGKQADPLYVHLKEQQGGLFGDRIKWNFTKFLVNREGEVVARYASAVKPEDIAEDIEKLL